MSVRPPRNLPSGDPHFPNWAEIELPKAWPDHLSLSSWRGVKEFWRDVVINKKKPVRLPDAVMGAELIPKYALQEFHNLPNGVYSHRFSRGYITGFDLSMLGELECVRQWISDQLNSDPQQSCPSFVNVQNHKSFLDLGCAGGKLAAVFAKAGAKDVWGIDPSPYLLKHAAHDFPQLSFVQGVAEDLPFANERFDGVGACFLFHELPPRYIELALAEVARVLKPGAKFVLAEPSPVQLEQGYGRLLKRYGVKGVYFKWLAGKMYEPFVCSWHNFDLEAAAQKVGLVILTNDYGMPVRRIVLQKDVNRFVG